MQQHHTSGFVQRKSCIKRLYSSRVGNIYTVSYFNALVLSTHKTICLSIEDQPNDIEFFNIIKHICTLRNLDVFHISKYGSAFGYAYMNQRWCAIAHCVE